MPLRMVPATLKGCDDEVRRLLLSEGRARKPDDVVLARIAEAFGEFEDLLAAGLGHLPTGIGVLGLAADVVDDLAGGVADLCQGQSERLAHVQDESLGHRGLRAFECRRGGVEQ
jgi:hypothetical protein